MKKNIGRLSAVVTIGRLLASQHMKAINAQSDKEKPELKPVPESMVAFLSRTNRELQKALPGLKTVKIIGGKKKRVKKDHLRDLHAAAKVEGIAGVQKYCDEVTKFYNDQLAIHKNKINGHA